MKIKLPSIMSCFILAISLRISRNISCFMASRSALDPPEVATAFSAMPFSFVTSISSAVEPKRLRPGFGDSEPLDDFPVGEDPFSKPRRSPESSCKIGYIWKLSKENQSALRSVFSHSSLTIKVQKMLFSRSKSQTPIKVAIL